MQPWTRGESRTVSSTSWASSLANKNWGYVAIREGSAVDAPKFSQGKNEGQGKSTAKWHKFALSITQNLPEAQ